MAGEKYITLDFNQNNTALRKLSDVGALRRVFFKEDGLVIVNLAGYRRYDDSDAELQLPFSYSALAEMDMATTRENALKPSGLERLDQVNNGVGDDFFYTFLEDLASTGDLEAARLDSGVVLISGDNPEVLYEIEQKCRGLFIVFWEKPKDLARQVMTQRLTPQQREMSQNVVSLVDRRQREAFSQLFKEIFDEKAGQSRKKGAESLEGTPPSAE
ncbi:MAG: hypothetical protein ACLFU1_09360 [Alphaproteobacteria bacterium]